MIAESPRTSYSLANETLGNWRLNTVHHTDCLIGLRQLPDSCIAVIVTSPCHQFRILNRH